ncbi:MAG TPA: Smr/MutS family protein [Stellaceae bacterium]|jgi:DNA-nicking Smr family endonuclease|nr:Smr/MutS family protein [Stellaceae bacterium]
MAKPTLAMAKGDSELWQAALRDVKPLRRRRPSAAAKPAPPQPALNTAPTPAAPPVTARPAAKPAAKSAARPVPLLPLTGLRAPGLDKASAERLKRGQYPIEARIDLHGMTQDDAHRALGDFIARSARAGLRCVLVITGKGLRRLGDESPGGGAIGILRNAAPRWLNEAPNRARILAFAAAQPRDGGGGALYVLLRRRGRAADA